MRFSFEGNPIEQVDSYKYLGVFLSYKKKGLKNILLTSRKTQTAPL